MSAKITVLLTVHNGMPYLPVCIESVLNQTYRNFEFVIIDDGSTDDSVEAIRAYRDKRIRLICNQQSLGRRAAFDQGLHQAHGDYLAFIDQAAIWMPDRLAQQVKFLKVHPEVGVVGSGAKIIDEQGRFVRNIFVPETHAEILCALISSNPLLFSSTMIRTALVVTEEQDYENGDSLPWLRLIGHTRFANIAQPLVCTRIGADEEIQRPMILPRMVEIFLNRTVTEAEIDLLEKSQNPESIVSSAQRETAIELLWELCNGIKTSGKLDLQEIDPVYSFLNNGIGIIEAAAARDEQHAEPQNTIDNLSLASRIADAGWTAKGHLYDNIFERFVPLRKKNAKASIITIAYCNHPTLEKHFAALQPQLDDSTELIYVMNGPGAVITPLIRSVCDKIVVTKFNTGECIRSRNLGALFADGDIIIFIDDYAIPDEKWLPAHLQAHAQYDAVSVRGRCKPKTSSTFNKLAKSYDLGEKPFPIFSDQEGNSSYRRQSFYKAGGWNDELFYGCEGIALSRSLLNVEPDMRKQIYWPDAIIYHDFAADEQHLAKKQKLQAASTGIMLKKQPDHKSYIGAWTKYYQRDDLLVRKQEQVSTKINQPFFSIVLPTYNRERYVGAAIASVLAQNCDNLELVVVDDGSTDATPDIIQSFSSDKLRFIRKKHSNAPDTYNHAFQAARGEFVIIANSDDELLPDTCRAYAALAAEYPDADVMYGHLIEINADDVEVRWHCYEDFYKNDDRLLYRLLRGNSIPNPGTCIRRTVFEKFGLYDLSHPRAHDYQFWSRIAGKVTFKQLPLPVCRYRVHTDGISYVSNVIDRDEEIRIAQGLLERNSLRTLFPNLDWSNENEAMARAWHEAGHLFLNYGGHDLALRYYNQSLIAAEHCFNGLELFAAVYISIGNVHLAHGNYDEAIRQFMNSLKIHDSDRACYKLGLVHRLMHNQRAAAEYYRKTLALNPDHRAAFNELMEVESATLDALHV